MHWNGFQCSKSLFIRHSRVKNQFSMNHLSINYFFTNTIILFSLNFSSDDQFLFFQFVARELQKLISRTESPLSLLPWYPTMLWIHNQGGARYQIILLEDEKFFCFSHVSLWLSHLLRINFKLTVFIFFVFWNINSEIRDYQNQDWRDTINV